MTSRSASLAPWWWPLTAACEAAILRSRSLNLSDDNRWLCASLIEHESPEAILTQQILLHQPYDLCSLAAASMKVLVIWGLQGLSGRRSPSGRPLSYHHLSRFKRPCCNHLCTFWRRSSHSFESRDRTLVRNPRSLASLRCNLTSGMNQIRFAFFKFMSNLIENSLNLTGFWGFGVLGFCAS